MAGAESPPQRLSGRIALVTGAGSGIGRAVALRLARDGATVVVTSLSQSGADETCARIASIGVGHAEARRMDVRDSTSVADTIRYVGDTLGRLDVLVSNAGVELVHEPSVRETSMEEWRAVLDTNLTGSFRLLHEAWDLLGEGSSVITVGSLNSLHPRPGAAAYAASKGGLLQFTRAAALDLAPKGVRANCVCPGNIDTPLTQSFADSSADPHGTRAAYAAEAPLGRLGRPEEVADVVSFLASTDSSFVTGSAVMVDGGASIS